MTSLTPIAPGTWVARVALPIASPSHTDCYVLEDAAGAVHLIDPGWDFGSTGDDLDTALATIGHGIADVATIVITHMHVDHLGLAPRIRAASGARVLMHPLEQQALDVLSRGEAALPDFDAWGIPVEERGALSRAVQGRVYPAFTSDGGLDHDQLLDVAGRRLRVIHTPGHTVGSISVHDEDEGLLFTGDTVLPGIFPGIGLGGDSAGSLGDYLVALDVLEALGEPLVCPGHGTPFTGLADRIDQTRAHQLARTAEVERIVLETPDATVWQVASRVSWTGGFAALREVHLASALAQTAMRMDYNRP